MDMSLWYPYKVTICNTLLHRKYLLFLDRFSNISSPVTVSDVEGVVTRLDARITPSFHFKSVCCSSVHGNLWDEQTIEVPRDTPTSSP